jgi:hypothetical protein
MIFHEVPPPPCDQGGLCPPADLVGGGDGVTIDDLVQWYANPIDVTNDGAIDTYDVLGYAGALGLFAEDSNNNGIIDAVDVVAVEQHSWGNVKRFYR